jgi:LmbE family N-acetylglucosaminyl deacetylase
MNILIVVAHPDDEVLGCGGTIARLAQEGADVFIAILGEGVTSRYPVREEADLSLVEQMRVKSREAGKIMGARELLLHALPDNRFDTVPLLEVIKIVESSIVLVRPEIIYTHHGGDLNIDHGIVHRAVLTAARPLPASSVREIYSFEAPSSTEWAFQRMEPVFRPNVFVNIARTIDLKLRALSCYGTEMRAFPHPRSPEGLTVIARRWGSVAGCEAAEAFELIRSIRS